MSDIGDDIFFRIGGILHEARMEECYGKMNVSSRKKWPETFKDFRRQRMDGQPWIDVAIAQVRALVKNALLAQRIEHEPSKLGVDGSNPSERANVCARIECQIRGRCAYACQNAPRDR